MSYVFGNLYWCWCWHHFKTMGHLRVSKTLTFKMRLGTLPFLWEWVLFAWEWKMISISKTEYLPSFWNRGLGGLGYGLFSWVWSIFREKELIILRKMKRHLDLSLPFPRTNTFQTLLFSIYCPVKEDTIKMS